MGTQTRTAAEAARKPVARWISCGFEELAHGYAGRSPGDPPFHCEVAIVGSGYGGAVAAAELAGRRDPETGKKARVFVLERGSEYLPGMFPTNEADLPGHVRFSTSENPQPQGMLDGFLDVRVGPDVCAVLACGLGGGSLINAGVMAEPAEGLWSETADLPYDEVRQKLGSLVGKTPNTIERNPHELPLKFTELKKLGNGSFTAAPLSISMTAGDNAAGIRLQECIQCGDCATGCNHSAKNSLDENLLVEAHRLGATLYTGATVTHLEKLPEGGWTLYVVHTSRPLRNRAGAPFELRARRVILAAGTFGSTEILLRSASEKLRFSQRLGRRFSANGDALAVAYGQKHEVNAVARESQDPVPTDANEGRKVGPTITGMIDLSKTSNMSGTIEEFAIPGPLRRLFAESFTLARCLQDLAQPDLNEHAPNDPDPLAVDEDALHRTQIFGLMGDDGAGGSLELIEPRDGHHDVGDGAIRVRWPDVRENLDFRLFDEQIAALKKLVPDPQQGGGRILPNPMWRPLPDELDGILDVPKGPITTVHPLGGCPMGNDVAEGAVDRFGRVFDPLKPGDFHERLAVLDGSVIPTALAVNPALTIAAIALRAVRVLRKEWELSESPIPPYVDVGSVRPRFTKPQYPVRKPTKVEIVERMSGPITLRGADGRESERIVELTMQFEPVELRELMGAAPRILKLLPGKSHLRTFTPKNWEDLHHYGCTDELFEAKAQGSYAITGTLEVLQREASTPEQRRWRAARAWLLNRGLRDIWQWGSQWLLRQNKPSRKRNRRKLLLNLTTRAGEVRRLDYKLDLGIAHKPDTAIHATRISGFKRFTYSRRGNPWNQLQQLFITEFPSMPRGRGDPPRLDLDLNFLASKRLPLLCLTEQDNHATALFDFASFAAYFARVLLTIHTWSLRKPDSPRQLVTPNRLPRQTRGLPKPEIIELDVGRHSDGTVARVRLTRFPRRNSPHKPLIMIHGYSASGTTFAHPAVEPNLANYMWRRKRDVWILDLRTSSGMPTASLPWTFEETAHEDIPAAFGHIVTVVQNERFLRAQRDGDELENPPPIKLDVIAHCMGSAMMTMAILGRPEPGAPFFKEREQLPKQIDCLILSQVAPTTVFSPANVFRAYAMGYLRHLLPVNGYQFHPVHEPTPMDQMLDRVLATLPHPEAEFDIANPWLPWKTTPWTRTRQRMDALYGRDFNVANVPQCVLDHIDDLFGPLNMDTVLSAIHFARTSLITNRAGRNVFVKRQRLREHWRDIKTLCVNGADNGLVDIATAYRVDDLMKDGDVRIFRTYIKDGYGHQDCLIGRDAVGVFAQMHDFLKDPENYESKPCIERPDWLPHKPGVPLRLGVPWLGPVRGKLDALTGKLHITLAPDPQIGTPGHVAIVPVVRHEKRYERDKSQPTLVRLWRGYGFGLTPLDVPLRKFARPVSPGYALLALFTYDEPAVLDKDVTDRIEAAIDAHLLKTDITAVADGVICERAPRLKRHAADPDVTFAFGSCQYPPGALDRELASASYSRLNALLANGEAERPKFVVLMGDQIYSDATGGLFDPTTSEDRYVLPYENWLRTAPVRSVLRQVPTYMMLDDHEIVDNWEPGKVPDPARDEPVKLGRSAYVTYQRTLGPPVRARPHTLHPLWYEESPAKLPFFFVDSRTDRQPRTLSAALEAEMLGEDQLPELKAWIASKHGDDDQPKFIVSSSMLLPRKKYYADAEASAFCSDSWQGYPATFHDLLAHIANSKPQNLVFLSGDEHHSCVACIKVTNLSRTGAQPVVFHSIHCSGLYSPFPFANGKPQDLLETDSFQFDVAGEDYRCEVLSTKFIGPGDGFATIRCVRNGAGWSVCYTFDQGRGSDELLHPHP